MIDSNVICSTVFKNHYYNLLEPSTKALFAIHLNDMFFQYTTSCFSTRCDPSVRIVDSYVIWVAFLKNHDFNNLEPVIKALFANIRSYTSETNIYKTTLFFSGRLQRKKDFVVLRLDHVMEGMVYEAKIWLAFVLHTILLLGITGPVEFCTFSE